MAWLNWGQSPMDFFWQTDSLDNIESWIFQWFVWENWRINMSPELREEIEKFFSDDKRVDRLIKEIFDALPNGEVWNKEIYFSYNNVTVKNLLEKDDDSLIKWSNFFKKFPWIFIDATKKLFWEKFWEDFEDYVVKQVENETKEMIDDVLDK